MNSERQDQKEHIDYESTAEKIWTKISKHLQEFEKPNAILLMGIPASGKSTSIKFYIETVLDDNLDNYIHIDPDIFMKLLPGYSDKHARDFNKHGVIISHKILTRAIFHRINFIYYGTGKNLSQYKSMIKKCKTQDFFTTIVNVVIPLEKAKLRAKIRSTKGTNQRVINNSVLDTIYSKLTIPQKRGQYKGLNNYEVLKTIVNFYITIDNNQSIDEDPTVIEYSEGLKK